jgi:hypothetical protein
MSTQDILKSHKALKTVRAKDLTKVTLGSNVTFSANAFKPAGGGDNAIDMLVDANQSLLYKDITIYGTTTTATAKLHFAMGDDADPDEHFILSDYASLIQKGTSGTYHFVFSLKDCPCRYISVHCSVAAAACYLYYTISTH